TKNDITIMIDAGYNYPRLKEKMEWLGIQPENIQNILITHQDTDHVGAVEEDSDGLFRDAKLYIGDIENRYLTGEKRRKVCYGLYRLSPVKINNRKELVHDGQVLMIDGIRVECFLVPGHTRGHLVYLIDDAYLFTGDTIWFKADGGKSVINMLAESNPLGIRSLKTLEEKLRSRNLHLKIITGHTGWTDDLDFAFAHTDEACNAWVKQLPHDPNAPYDAYDESDDTEENARKQLLPKADQEGWRKPDYKNWMPDAFIAAMAAGTVVTAAGLFACGICGLGVHGRKRALISSAFGLGAAGFAAWTGYGITAKEAFSYSGKRQLSKQIIEGTAEYIQLPEGGKGLDVGCGSGALTIACAKRNPQGEMIGIDHWGPEYAAYSKSLCEKNAKAEGVSNVSFRKGDAVHLDFPDETFDAVTSNYVYHNIVGKNKQELLLETLRVLKKGGTFAIHDLMSRSRYGDMEAFCRKLKNMGYEKVELINTTEGKFMSRRESHRLLLNGSTLLIGKK
ncbi:MAG: methyltransferase domain-containing protein, partial [Bulleidia sp.]|nr:methyltransferase domain-containing protein [Bulleidia sp.]